MTVRADLVRHKLHLISEDLARLLPFREVSLDELQADDIRMAAVERMLERIVMRPVDVNEPVLSELATGREPCIARLTYRDTFLRLADLGVHGCRTTADTGGPAGTPAPTGQGAQPGATGLAD